MTAPLPWLVAILIVVNPGCMGPVKAQNAIADPEAVRLTKTETLAADLCGGRASGGETAPDYGRQ
jgi:hypothetical protein